MNKLLKITASTLLILLLIIVGLYFLAFGPIGSTLLEPYVKKELEEKIGMPVEITAFDLDYGTSSLQFSINKQAQVSLEVSEYDLSKDAYAGIYHIKTDTFTYKNKKLNNADIKGNFKYMPEDIYVEGNGTALSTNVDYRLKILDDLPQQILLDMKEAELSELLELIGHHAIAEGKIDVEINIPDMGGDREHTYGYIDLKKSYFNSKLVKELYEYTLPDNSYLQGRIDGNLEGETVSLVGDVQSNLFVFQIKNALGRIFSGDWSAEYALDVKDMRILTKNKLTGALDLKGKIKGVGTIAKSTAKSNSLGGDIHFSSGFQTADITFDNIALEKVLSLLKQPAYAKGKLNSKVSLKWYPSNTAMQVFGKVEKWHEWTYALYDIRVDKGVLTPEAMKEMSRYNIPANNTFSIQSKGKIAHKKLTSNASSVKSTLTDVKFSSLNYDFEKKILTSNYDLLLHDMRLLFPKTEVKKSTPLMAKGSLKFKDKLAISGNIKGLGKKVTFSHDSKTFKLDASQFFVEKLLTLMGLPMYVKGTMDSQIVLTNLKPREGTFSIKNTNLVTQPKEMKALMGEELKENIALDASGTFKRGKGYGQSNIKTSIGDVFLEEMVYDSETKAFKSKYTLDIPNLQKWDKVIDRKLYGPLVLKGEWSKEKVRTVTGKTTTLGGKVSSRLVGDDLHSTIDNVPLDNILALLGHKKDFLGKAYGKGKYNLKSKSGVVDIDITDFQIKPSPTTNTIKMVIGKDPARVIFDSTKFHADIKGKITDYTLHAVGSKSSIDITDGRIDKINDTNTAKFTFVYDKYTVHGKIKGSVKDPKVTVDTSALFQDKIDEELQDKIEKALGGKAGDLLRNLKF